MNTYKSVEEYAEHVRKETAGILGALCHRLGPEHPAAVAVGGLLTEAANIVQQNKMQQEQQASTYDLGALGVNASEPSDSETGYEDRG